jgi:putative exporter of polyketide antibiotics
MLLATPLARQSWAARGAAGVYLAIVAMTAVLAAAVGLGAVVSGSDAFTPMGGSLVLGLFAAAVSGVGFAVGGLFRTSIAAEIAALFVVATFLIDLVAPALKLPDWVHQLALTGHLGQPMVGRWDAGGIVACLVIALAGAALGAWGMSRRDVAR